MMELISVELHDEHLKNDFSCGNSTLDNFLKLNAKKESKNDLSKTFVIEENNQIIGYYTITMDAVPTENFSSKFKANYSSIPVVLLGRLAVDKRFQGQSKGSVLLIDAFRRITLISKYIGAYAIIVDPIDSKAITFYLNYGFVKLSNSNKMFIKMKQAEQLF